MKRIPNVYIDTAPADEAPGSVTLCNQELAQYIAGQTDHLSAETEQKLKNALSGSDTKLRVLLLAYAQKGVMRLSRLMNALDKVDAELLTPYRIRAMDNKELISLFSEINREKSNTAKEVSAIAALELNGAGLAADLRSKNSKVALSDTSKGRVVQFFKERIEQGGEQ